MKSLKSFLFLAIIFIPVIAISQNEYYDALFLIKHSSYDSYSKVLTLTPVNYHSDSKIFYEQRDSILSILSNYFPGIDINTNETNFPSKIIDNPFFKDHVSYAGKLMGSSPLAMLNKFVSNGSQSIGGLNVTNFADGLAKFLVERSKEELNVAFFSEFKDYIKTYPEVRIIFPTTYNFLNEIYSYQYAAMLPALKAAFQKDLNAFSTNLLNLRYTAKYEGYNTDKNVQQRADEIIKLLNTADGRSVIGAILIANGIARGKNVADIIEELDSDDICNKHFDESFPNLIQLIDLVSKSLRSKEDGRVWITKQQLSELTKDDITLRIYLGLIYAIHQKSPHPIQFVSGSSKIIFQDFLTDLSKDLNSAQSVKFKENFNSIANAICQVADNAKNINASNPDNNQPSIIIYADYISSVADLFKQSACLFSNNSGISITLSALYPEIQTFTNVIDNATNCCYDLKSQNYTALVLHSSSLLGEILKTSYTKDCKRDFIKYGIFMANIVEAKNSDEVHAAIEAAVLPVGSSSVKRETDFNVSLNAFIGPYGGTEFLPALKQKQWAFTTGITAPVGVALSWGNKGIGKIKSNSKESGGKSLTLFIPVIDVGSLASFRMGNDSSNVASEVTLSNIISPGLFIYYGFGKCPVSIGLGGQLGPQLRGVTATDINIDKNYYIRFGFNVVVDIPFFNLYTKN